MIHGTSSRWKHWPQLQALTAPNSWLTVNNAAAAAAFMGSNRADIFLAAVFKIKKEPKTRFWVTFCHPCNLCDACIYSDAKSRLCINSDTSFVQSRWLNGLAYYFEMAFCVYMACKNGSTCDVTLYTFLHEDKNELNSSFLRLLAYLIYTTWPKVCEHPYLLSEHPISDLVPTLLL